MNKGIMKNGMNGGSISPINDQNGTNSDTVENDMVSQENVSVRDRVVELERKLQEQEDEIILLRSSMADVLRRLSQLENQPKDIRNVNGTLLPKYMSKSSSNLRSHSINTLGNSHNNGITQKARRPISPSPKRVSSTFSVHNGSTGEQAVHTSTPLRKCSGRITQSNTPLTPSRLDLNSPISHSTSTSNIRRSDASHTDLTSPATVRSPLSPTGNQDGSVSSSRFGSMATLSGFGSMRSVAHSFRSRDPVYSQEEGCLKLYLRGKTLNLYSPSTVHNVDVFQTLPAPKEKLKLEWVYGYRGRDSRANIHCLPTGEIVYFVANVVVLFNVEEQLQRHYLGHTDDVRCIAIHPNRLIVATGQAAKHGILKSRKTCSRGEMESLMEEGENLAHIRIWDCISLQTLHVIGMGDFERALSCVSFSKTDGGGLLAAVDESYDHTLSIWDWQRKHRITETKSSNDPVLACEFHPIEKNSLITSGKGQISFWTFDGTTLQRKIGLFEGRDKAPKYILCLAFTETGYVLSGDSNGTILLWNRATSKIMKQVQKVHEGGVFSLCALKGGRFLSGGGKDGKLMEWDMDLKPVSNVVQVPADLGPVRTVVCGKGNMLVIGTTHNCILQGTMQFGFNPIMQAHFDELCGLCIHPIQQQFLTCAFDRMVRLWDSQSKSVLWKNEIADPAHCASFHPSGAYIAIGTTVGRWMVMDVMTRDVLMTSKDGNDIITCMEYSPDGSHIAIGSYDGGIYIYSVSENGRRYNRIGRCNGHTGPISHIDWSSDSEYLRSNSGNLEIYYWRPVVQKLVQTPDEIRDVKWATERCPLNFNTAGLWSENGDGNEINACDVSAGGKLLAAASGGTGEVKLLQYPCFQPKASSYSVSGHTGQVTDVRFLQNETRLISIGGKDTCIMQWEII